MIIAALVLCLILVLWPQIHTSVIQQVVDSYTFIP
jgi:hypothetical protein